MNWSVRSSIVVVYPHSFLRLGRHIDHHLKDLGQETYLLGVDGGLTEGALGAGRSCHYNKIVSYQGRKRVVS